MNEVDERVRAQIRSSIPDPDTPAHWPRALRKCIYMAKQAGVTVLYGPEDDPHDVWLRLNIALSERAHATTRPSEYFVTFTVPTTEEHRDPRRVLSRASSFSKRYAAQISWCLEVTKKGFPHVHMLVKPVESYKVLTCKRKQIAAMNNNYCQGKDWLMKARSRAAVEKYIAKKETKPEQDYMDRWGLTHYFGSMDSLECF